MSIVLFWLVVLSAFIALATVVYTAIRTDADAMPYPGGNRGNVIDSILSFAPFAVGLAGMTLMRALRPDIDDAMFGIVLLAVVGISALVFMAPPVRAARHRMDRHRRSRDRNAGRLPD